MALEIHSINEKCIFLRRFIHDLALKLKSTGVCTGIRRLRYGHFGLERSLVRQEWSLEKIIENLEKNEELLVPDKLFVGMKAESCVPLPLDAGNHLTLLGECSDDGGNKVS